MRVKNNAPGARTFNVRTDEVGPDNKPLSRVHLLESGREDDLDLIQDPKKDKVLVGMSENMIVVDGRELPEVEFGAARKSSAQTTTPAGGGNTGAPDFEEMTVDELKAYITDKGQTPRAGALKADLVKQAESIR